MRARGGKHMARLTPKQEAFAQFVAQGETQSEAFRKAYPRSRKWMAKSVHERASELANFSKVVARIAELRAPAVEAMRITQEERIASYLDIARRAREAKDLQAETKAQDSITRVTGFFTADRQNARSPIEDLDAAQRDALRLAVSAALEAAEKDAATERANS